MNFLRFYKSQSWRNKRVKILRRDNHKCRNCELNGIDKTANTVHHCTPVADNFELRLENENLVSLCGECHNAMHDQQHKQLTQLGLYWQRVGAGQMVFLETGGYVGIG